MKPIIFGCAGTALSQEEKDFFSAAKPFGFILFQRNCATPAQVRKLVKELHECVHAPVFIDQEGGRVQRLKPPHWPSLPPLRLIGKVYERDKERGLEAMKLHARLTARRLYRLGIHGNCSPVLDLFIEEASSAIGDRALSRKPEVVSALGRVAVDTHLEHGILPVIKHLPGHGRVKVDPHLTLPVVETERQILEAEDFVPFQSLKDAPIGMNCHVVFKALDPEQPVSMSQKVHEESIRGVIGFQGLVFSDDLSMKALQGSPPELALRALIAGADVALYCPGNVPTDKMLSDVLPMMKAIADVLPEMPERSEKRWQDAQKRLQKQVDNAEVAQDAARLKELVG